MILVIDNYDSFTFNLVQALQAAGADVRVLRNDAIDRAGVETLAADEAAELRGKVEGDDDAPPVTDASVRSKARVDVPIPTPPFWGVREVDVDLDEVYPYLDRHVLFTLHWGARGMKREEKKRFIEADFAPRLERMWREQDYLHPRALLGYFPCNADGNELVVWDPEAPGERQLERLVFPRQPRHDRICLSDFYRPLDSG